MIDSRIGWVPVCGCLFIALLTFVMVRSWQLDHTPLIPAIELAHAQLSQSQLSQSQLQDNAAQRVTTDHRYRFKLLHQFAAIKKTSRRSDQATLDVANDMPLSDLDNSRFVRRSISNNNPTRPVIPSVRAPYFTSETHKLIAAEAVDEAIFDDPEIERVPFEVADASTDTIRESDDRIIEIEERKADVADGSNFAQVAYQTQEPVRYKFEQQSASDAPAPEKTKIPTLRSGKAKQQRSSKKQAPKAWSKPKALVEQLEALQESAMTSSWAKTTIQVLNGLEFISDLADPKCLIVFGNLEQQLGKLEFLTRQVSTSPTQNVQLATGVLAIQLREVGYAIERRLEVWPLVHYLATQQINQPQQQQVDSHNVSQFLLASRTKLNTNEVERGWAEYLQLEQAASVFNSLNQKAYDKKKASRAVLARLYSPALSNSQNKYLESTIDTQTIGVLKITAADNVQLPRLLKRLENLEANNNGASQFYLNDSYQNLLWSNQQGYHALADRLQTHYRNANFRVSISERQLNRMLPRFPTTREPYRDNVMGAKVVGQNQISNQIRVVLLPDPNQVSMRLESYGKVNSRTTAVRDGITVENAGTSRFRIIKRLAFGQNGIFAYRPVTTSHIAQKVVGLKSSVDNIPGIGRLVRNIARTKIEEQAPATKRYAQTKLEQNAEQRFDREIEQGLEDLEKSLTDKLLHPLIAMDLEPDPIQISTTQERINMRYRLAGRDQMASSTSRPRGLPDSLINMQIHESALNNITSRFELAGQKFTTEELVAYINGMFGSQVVELDNTKSNHAADFHFAPFDPFRVQFVDGKILISFNLRSFRIGEGKRWKNLTVKATYDPLISNGFFLTMNRAEEGIRVKGKRLNVRDQIAVRLVCQLLFPEQFEVPLIPEKMANQLEVSSLQATQFVIANGWLGLSLNDPAIEQPVIKRFNARAHTARRRQPGVRQPVPGNSRQQPSSHYNRRR